MGGLRTSLNVRMLGAFRAFWRILKWALGRRSTAGQPTHTNLAGLTGKFARPGPPSAGPSQRPGKGPNVVEHRIDGDLEWPGLPPGASKWYTALDCGEEGHREAVRVGVRAQLRRGGACRRARRGSGPPSARRRSPDPRGRPVECRPARWRAIRWHGRRGSRGDAGLHEPVAPGLQGRARR